MGHLEETLESQEDFGMLRFEMAATQMAVPRLCPLQLQCHDLNSLVFVKSHRDTLPRTIPLRCLQTRNFL